MTRTEGKHINQLRSRFVNDTVTVHYPQVCPIRRRSSKYSSCSLRTFIFPITELLSYSIRSREIIVIRLIKWHLTFKNFDQTNCSRVLSRMLDPWKLDFDPEMRGGRSIRVLDFKGYVPALAGEPIKVYAESTTSPAPDSPLSGPIVAFIFSSSATPAFEYTDAD